ADDGTRALREARRFDRERRRGRRRFEETVGILIDPEQALDSLEQGEVRAADRAEVVPTLAGVVLLQGRDEEIAFGHRTGSSRQCHPPHSAPSGVGTRKRISGFRALLAATVRRCRTVALHLLEEKRFSVGPEEVGGPCRDAERFGGLLERQGSEVAKLHE